MSGPAFVSSVATDVEIDASASPTLRIDADPIATSPRDSMPTSVPSFTTGSRRIRRSAISALASQSCVSGEVVSSPFVVAMSPKSHGPRVFPFREHPEHQIPIGHDPDESLAVGDGDDPDVVRGHEPGGVARVHVG